MTVLISCTTSTHGQTAKRTGQPKGASLVEARRRRAGAALAGPAVCSCRGRRMFGGKKTAKQRAMERASQWFGRDKVLVVLWSPLSAWDPLFMPGIETWCLLL